MANELRVRANLVAGALSADLTTGGTTMSSAGLADLPVVDTTNHAAIVLFQTDAVGRVTKKEIVHVTAHTAGATTATILRAQESTIAQAWNGTSSPDKWVHGPTATDSSPLLARAAYSPNPTVQYSSPFGTSLADVDATNLAVTFIAPQSGSVIVRLSSLALFSTATVPYYYALREGTTEVTGSRTYMRFNNAGALNVTRETATMHVSGLTPGTSHTWKWAAMAGGTAAGNIYAGDDGTSNRYGPATIEVWDATVPA